MPESQDNLHIFYRFTVPGVAFTTWVFLMLPSSFVLRIGNSLAGSTILVSVLVGASFVIGWLSYYSIYPIWKRLLQAGPKRLGLYPESQMLTELGKSLPEKKVQWSPEHVWSYFLWNHCPVDLRQRIKSLADYGHSLYLVACSFIVMPLLLALATLLRGQYSTFSWLVGRVVSPESITLLASETVLALLAILLGVYLLLQGRKRITYAHDLQSMAMQEHRAEFEQMLVALTRTDSA